MCGCPSCGSHWGPGPQPRHVPWLGIELATFWFSGQHSIHWPTPARANSFRFVLFLSLMVHHATHPFKLLGEMLEISNAVAHHSSPNSSFLLRSVGCHRALAIFPPRSAYNPVLKTFADHFLPKLITSKTHLKIFWHPCICDTSWNQWHFIV